MRLLPHVHDYEMDFIGSSSERSPHEIESIGLDYRLVCQCGDVAPSMHEAVNRMISSRTRHGVAVIVWSIAMAVVVSTLVVLW